MHQCESELIQVDGIKRGTGRPKFILVEIVKKEMSNKEAIEYTMILYRNNGGNEHIWSIPIS
jgi:ribosomal protein S24E